MIKLRWKTPDVISKGGELAKLLALHRDDFLPRVAPEVINTVVTKVPDLRERFIEQADSKSDKQASTVTKRNLLEGTARYVADRRKVISNAFPDDPGTRKDFGVGHSLDRDSLSSVTAALQIFITAAHAAPEKATSAGILASDIEHMVKTLADLKSGAATQVDRTAEAKNATRARNELQHEIEEAMVKIVTASTLVYEKRPELLALFKSTLPSSSSKARKDGKENQTDGAGSETPSDPK